MSSNRIMNAWGGSIAIIIAAAGLGAVACAAETAGSGCTAIEDCAQFGAQYVCASGTCVDAGETSGSGDTTEGESSTTESEGSGTSAESSSSGGGSNTSVMTSSTTTPPTTTAGPEFVDCDPEARVFGMESGALQAAVLLNPEAMTCAASGASGEPPQIVLDVRSTNLADMTAEGLEIVDSVLGTYIDSTHVTGITTDILNTVEATLVSDGSPVTIEFKIETQGPVLGQVRVSFG